jgi:hypothetical protein
MQVAAKLYKNPHTLLLRKASITYRWMPVVCCKARLVLHACRCKHAFSALHAYIIQACLPCAHEPMVAIPSTHTCMGEQNVGVHGMLRIVHTPAYCLQLHTHVPRDEMRLMDYEIHDGMNLELDYKGTADFS